MSTTSIQLTPAERPAYAHLFALADPQSTGMVSGSAAVSFFALSGLPTPVLGSIWSISDSENNGFLGPAHFSAALRLIGHAQSGKVVTEDLVQEAGPMPTFKGVTIPAHLNGGAGAMSTPSRSSSTMIQPQLTGGGGFGPNDIKPEDRARYNRIFASAGPQAGLLDGEKAKEIFVKSKLPFDKLGAIWNLADSKARGKLDLTDFIVGMHFIQSTMNGSLTTIPASLPAGLYEKAASGNGAMPPSPGSATPLGAQNTGGSTGFVPRQMTGSNQFATPASPLRSNIRSPPPSILQPQRTGSTFPSNAAGGASWAVSGADKTKSDRFFDGLDQERKGVLEGQAAVPFFVQSGLNEATLAHIWDLSDITQSGTLTRDEFAVAMHLINLKITGSDLPSELPSTLVPPSLRGTNLPQAVNPKETDTQRDLFSLMDDDVDLPVSTASAFAVPAPSNAAASMQASKAAPVPASGPFDDDFMGSNARFGSAAFPAAAVQSPTMTGGSSMSANRAAPSAFESAAPFGDASSEAANQRLALDSTQKSLATMETKRDELEKSVTGDGNSISDLSTRLETVRMRHQTESEAVKALTERQASQALELKKLREESVREESELSRLKAEKDEIEQSLMKDREDVREMKRLVGERTKEKEQLKVELEKVKKEARMQKGMVAIGKKQLSQAEGEVTGVKGEMEHAKAGNVEDDEHAEHGEVAMGVKGETTRELTPGAEAALSPAASVRSNNPFDRFPAHAGAPAAAGVASAAAIVHHESTGETAGKDDDPFGAGNRASSAPLPAPAGASQPAFDDSFGQSDAKDAATPAAGGEKEPGNVNQAFDDAFADLDEPSKEKDRDETEAITADVPGSFTAAKEVSDNDYSGGLAQGVDGETADGEESGTVRAPTADEVATDSDVLPLPLQSDPNQGKGVAREGEEEESSDEEEGPEDVDRRDERVVDSPDEMGKGKAAVIPGQAIDNPASTSDVATPPAVTNVADRFPELVEENTPATAPIPTSQPAAPTLASGLSASTLAGPLSAVHTGTTSEGGLDAFHDAQTDAPAQKEATPTDSGFTHERFSTALDNSDAGVRSVSPSKTRRAPPPAPVRSATGSNGTNVGPFASSGTLAAAAAPPASASAAPLDDFDAAFEDLGPTANAGGVGNTSALSGFDDTFGDADGFDFVPSFNDQVPASKSQAQTGGFDGFDSAFDSAFDPASAPSSEAATKQHQQRQASAPGSGFSFDDAFAPSQPPSQPQSQPAASSGLPPSSSGPPPALPSRAGTTTGGAAPSTGTGALPDDAAPVRQLCAMGFTRPDVIKSLEKSNYRTDKALERLLAQT